VEVEMISGTGPAELTGSAQRWGPLWGARPADWALVEEQQVPTYEAALRHVRLEPGQAALDVGCGVGVFLELVTARGARGFGLDAAAALLELVRERVPQADLRVGDMEAMPFEEDAFDVVTGFNSFFFANDIVAALREAGRVARLGAPVVIQVWGAHERNDLEPTKEIVRPFLPPRPAGAPPEPDYATPGVLEGLAVRAGLRPERSFDTAWAYEFHGEQTLMRALLAPAGLAVLIEPARRDEVKEAIFAGMSRTACRTGAIGCATSSTTSSREPDQRRGRSLHVALQLQLTHVHRRSGPRGLRRVHRSEGLTPDAHVFGGVEQLEHDRRPLSLIDEYLQPLGRHIGRRPARLLDTGQHLLHALCRHVGEPDNAHVHKNLLFFGRAWPSLPAAAQPRAMRR
jgi:SAM-dependent methyltransferase